MPYTDYQIQGSGIHLLRYELHEKLLPHFSVPDYEGVLGRLRSEVLIKKFAKKFLDDGSYASLKKGLEEQNGEEAFRAAHTLKGVCQNLGFDNLYEVSFDITEKLRGRDTDGCEELFAKVTEQYEKTTDAIRMMED